MSDRVLAVVLAMGAGLCWGIGEVFTKAVLHTGKVGPMTAIAVRSTVALPVLWLVWWAARRTGFSAEPAGLGAGGWLRDGSVVWKLVLGSGVIAGAGGMALFYAALARGEVGRVKPIAFVVAPAVGALLGWMLLGEAMSARKIAAIGLIAAGLILLTGK